MWFVFYSPNLKAQEHLTNYDFHVHQQITNQNERLKSGTTLLQLPFFDDFIQNKIYPVKDDNPNQNLWINSGAFVNFNYAINPPSYGCVTLDGLAGNGAPYTYVGGAYGGADTLTSKFINLSQRIIGDSIYLSFFFEPEGNGDYPDDGDSLIVEFKDKNNNWTKVWSQNGYSSEPKADSFMQVLILVDTVSYLDSFFQFRFRNYATISGNNDHWHIDYVKMDKNRHYNSFDIHDVAFTNLPSKPLKKYFHMPWNQYLAYASGEMATSFNFSIFNNWFVGHNINSGCLVTDYLAGDTLQNYPASANNLNGDSIMHLTISPNYTIPATLQGDTYCRHFVNEKFYFNPGVAEFHGNDTFNFQTIFTNYFSYDDGTAEKAWDVRGTSSEFALEYTLNIADTLKAIQVQWAHMNADESNELVNLMVWQSLDFTNAINDVVLHKETFMKPIYVDSTNGFTTYILDTAQALPAGKFYIGFFQLMDSVNVGLDVNNDAHSHLYYNVGLGWDTSKYKGALMMRPMFGKCIPEGTGIENIAQQKNKIILYPNPTDAATIVKLPYQSNWNISIFNMQGEMVQQNNVSENLATLHLNEYSDGVYFIRATDVTNGKIFSDKIIKQ